MSRRFAYVGILVFALVSTFLVSGKSNAFGTIICAGAGQIDTLNGGVGDVKFDLSLEPSGYNWHLDFADSASGFIAQHANANSCGQTFGTSPNYAPDNGIRPKWIPIVSVGGIVKGVPQSFKKNNNPVKCVIQVNRKEAFNLPSDNLYLYFYQSSDLPSPAPSRYIIWPTNGVPFSAPIKVGESSPGWFFLTYL